MNCKHYAAGILATALLAAPLPAAAAPSDDLASIHGAIESLRHDYEAKIDSLEARLRKAEAEAKAAKASAAAAQTAATTASSAAQSVQQTVAVAAAAPAPVAPRPPAAASAFNPGIAVVLNGFFVASSRDPAAARIPGFALGDEAGGPPRGFSIGESEITLGANIDPFFKGGLNLSFGNAGHVNVEEAFLQTTSLGDGFTLKGGRFFSAIGYLNERHAHNWSFSDAPLPYRAFLDNQYGDDGVQVLWLAPVDVFLEFGAEWFRGAVFPSGGAANQGRGTLTAFVHTGDDFNESSSWLAAASLLHTRADGRETGSDTFSGTDDMGIVSLVYKWAPGGNPVQRNLVLTGEFFYDREKGAFDAVPVDLSRTGWYVQGVYQFVQRWSVGLRYATLGADNPGALLAGSTLDPMGHAPRALTGLVEFDTSEFGRLRLQYTRDESDLRPVDVILFQYTVIYGPHAAHRY